MDVFILVLIYLTFYFKLYNILILIQDKMIFLHIYFWALINPFIFKNTAERRGSKKLLSFNSKIKDFRRILLKV